MLKIFFNLFKPVTSPSPGISPHNQSSAIRIHGQTIDCKTPNSPVHQKWTFVLNVGSWSDTIFFPSLSFHQIDLWGLVSTSNLNAILSEGLFRLQFILFVQASNEAEKKITFNRHRHLMIFMYHRPTRFYFLIHFWYLFDCMMKLTSIWNPPSASVFGSRCTSHIWRYFRRPSSSSFTSRSHSRIYDCCCSNWLY